MSNQKIFEKDTFSTSAGRLEITFLGHGSLLFSFNEKQIYIDPYSKVADYGKLPKADLILLTHEHRDHLDMEAIDKIQWEGTRLVVPEVCADQIRHDHILKNGETCVVKEIQITALPAYNLVHKRVGGQPFHPPGIGNGYVLGFGDLRIYVAGDTENIPEMKALQEIDIAFLPMNLPYTMTPEMVADAAKAFRPRILYPYHYGNTDTTLLIDLLKDQADIEVRIRNMA
jgi:L-ascorbate metabolism protein UlaG (beta-lactamase superfamily)